MWETLSDKRINEFNSLFKGACTRINGIIILGGKAPEEIGFFDKLKVRKSIKELEKCLILEPNHWQSMWFLAKAYQRLGEHHSALLLFERAMKIETNNHSIPQEASLECIHLDNIEKAIVYSEEAIRRSPSDIFLIANHAVNLLIAAKDNESLTTIKSALLVSPKDSFILGIQKLIENVIQGQARRPNCASALPKVG